VEPACLDVLRPGDAGPRYAGSGWRCWSEVGRIWVETLVRGRQDRDGDAAREVADLRPGAGSAQPAGVV